MAEEQASEQTKRLCGVCVCRLCDIRIPNVTYKDVCCRYCYRPRPRSQPSWEIMKGCVWVQWTRLIIQFIWIGEEKENNARAAEARRLINQREARSTFYDAAETVGQMITFGHITEQQDAFWFLHANMDPWERGESQSTGRVGNPSETIRSSSFNYRPIWEEIFHLKDGYGESVAVHEDDDLLCLNKKPSGEWKRICLMRPEPRQEWIGRHYGKLLRMK